MSDLDSISKQADAFAAARALLAERVTALNDGMAQLRRQHIAGIKRALDKTVEAQAALHDLVKSSPDAFAKPKTRVFSGVKVGFQKGKGVISFPDVAAVIRRIKRHLPRPGRHPHQHHGEAGQGCAGPAARRRPEEAGRHAHRGG